MANINGTRFSDTLVGTNQRDVIFGRGGNDSVNAGAGDDTIIVVDGDDTVLGGEGNDFISAYGGNDLLKGGGGNDSIYGDTDYFGEPSAGPSNDTLKGGGGADRLDGGRGTDTASYIESPTGVFVSFITNTAAYGDAEGDTLVRIENLTGSNYGDDLWGDNISNTLDGLAGNDTLKGFGGQDTLSGGAGNDFLNGGTGRDTMAGGTESDTYIVDHADDVVIESGGQGIDAVRTSVSWVLTAGADVELVATDSDQGTTAIDLTGNATGNELRGNNGNNMLSGREGADYLTGLAGQDRFLFDTALGPSNVDRILDFNVADDTIVLDDDIFSSGLAANNSVAGSQFVIGAAALDAGDRIIYNSGTGAVYYDSDGTGAAAAIQFATLSPGLALTNHDFFVVA